MVSQASPRFDVAVIGSGPGGYVAAIRAAQLGLRVALIEKDPQLGGTCLNVGCIPSKALLQSSELYSKIAKDAKQHGIECGSVALDFPKMMERKSQVVQSLVNGVAGLVKRNQIATFTGKGRLIGPHEIEVDNGQSKQQLEASHVILATGSEPTPLSFLPVDEKTVLTSTGALSLPSVPKKLLIIGGGVIGVELASVYSRLGSQVTIIEMLDRICPAIDPAISKLLMQSLKKQGIEFLLSAEVTKVKTGPDGVSLFLNYDNKSTVITGNQVLVAVGRRPFSAGLGLEELGVAKTPKDFVIVNDEFRTSIPHIFAIGDLIEGTMLAHRAFEEAVAVAEIIAGQKPHPVNYLAIPNVIYTYPEVAVIGLTEKEARDAGLEIKVGTFQFRGNPRARCSGEEEGLVKVIGEAKTGKLIGMHIIGPHASELINAGVMAMKKGATLADIGYAPHAHPTLSEAIKEAALNAMGQALHL